MTTYNFRIKDCEFRLRGDLPTRMRRKYRIARNYAKRQEALGNEFLTRDEIKRSFLQHIVDSPHLHQ